MVCCQGYENKINTIVNIFVMFNNNCVTILVEEKINKHFSTFIADIFLVGMLPNQTTQSRPASGSPVSWQNKNINDECQLKSLTKRLHVGKPKFQFVIFIAGSKCVKLPSLCVAYKDYLAMIHRMLRAGEIYGSFLSVNTFTKGFIPLYYIY